MFKQEKISKSEVKKDLGRVLKNILKLNSRFTILIKKQKSTLV
jgi:hypothetical protein